MELAGASETAKAHTLKTMLGLQVCKTHLGFLARIARSPKCDWNRMEPENRVVDSDVTKVDSNPAQSFRNVALAVTPSR
jgi:hypothetical protein